MGSYVHLGPDDQVLLRAPTYLYVQNGPWTGQLNPFHKQKWRKAQLLSPLQYGNIEDILTGVRWVVTGPKLVFLGAYEEMAAVMDKVVLQKHQYLRLVDRSTGVERIITGPTTVVPTVTESFGKVQDAVWVNTGSAVVVRDKLTGDQTLVTKCNLPSGVWYPKWNEEVVDIRELIYVLPHEALVVRDVHGKTTVYSGRERHEGGCGDSGLGSGGTAFFLPPFSKIVRMRWSQYNNSNSSGSTNVGPPAALLMTSPTYYKDLAGQYDKVVGTLGNGRPLWKKKEGNANRWLYFNNKSKWTIGGPAEKDKNFNTSNGWIYQHPDDKGVYTTPDAVAKWIAWDGKNWLKDEQIRCEIVKEDASEVQSFGRRLPGALAGPAESSEPAPAASEEDSFELEEAQPDYDGLEHHRHRAEGRRLSAEEQISVYDESSGTRRLESIFVDVVPATVSSAPKHVVTAIDLRTQKSFYAYEVRTNDNVRLVLEGALFWGISDVRRVLKTTSDPEGDVWAKCRSTLIATVSAVSLQTFMVSFNDIVADAFQNSRMLPFWSDRGLQIIALELNRYTPLDKSVAVILRRIIRQSVQRINALQKQQSDNDVAMEKLTADKALEINRTQFIEREEQNSQIATATEGAVIGGRTAATMSYYLDTLEDNLPNRTERIDLYKQQKTYDSTEQDLIYLTTGPANIFMTPKDMELRLQMPHQSEL